MDRLPFLAGYPRGLRLGEHPDVPWSHAIPLAWEDGWTDIYHGPRWSLVVRRMSARRVIRNGDGVIVRRAVAPRHIALAAGAVVAAVVGAVWL